MHDFDEDLEKCTITQAETDPVREAMRAKVQSDKGIAISYLSPA
ncbi:MAG: hypothetical protein BSOLF_1655 [Candidatus Carbobacillus altaicus]|uniref:Uncharacterized protein n=1 Tax=Candidatus Carbonibacillus altaicus TaxID=2163959 RepID=A0A2R6Y3S5_9BACL|nr:MAG: hypothetical protein BSOLF_1655 [Candidatus Carbobacillus altaicus]